jgi:hypothetical protein
MEQKKLIADVMVGGDPTRSIVLASHPDERMDPDGTDPSLTRRTIVLTFDGQRFTDATSLAFPLDRAWNSTNGTGYCTPIRGHDVHLYTNGAWTQERFASQDEDVLRIWGLSGPSSQEDRVYISTEGTLYIREGGAWAAHRAPDPVQSLYGVHGRSPDELYVCSDAGVLLWTGTRFEELEDDPRSPVKAIRIVGDEIYAGGRFLLHWTKASGWQRWEPAVRNPTAIIDIGGVVIVGTFQKGVMERQGAAFGPVTRAFMCLDLQPIGHGAFATGDDGTFVRAAGRWQEVAMPLCAVDQLPNLR